MSMTVRAGMACGFALNALASVQDTTVTQPAAHGVVTIPESHRIRYQARPG